jgi:hypothetical protein
MKKSIYISSCLLLLLCVNAYGFNTSHLTLNHEKPNKIKYDNVLNHTLYLGGGFRTGMWDYNFSVQVFQRFSLGAGFSSLRQKRPIHSASDKHMLKIRTFPMYAYANFYLKRNEEVSWYIFGKYGIAMGKDKKYWLEGEEDDNFRTEADNSQLYDYIEGGVGVKYYNGNRYIHFELGQFYTTAKGILYSTYNSEIKYDMEFYNLMFRFGVTLNKY